MSSRRVLITGSTGFIGGACVSPLLKRGFEVHGVSSGRRATAGLVESHICDLLDDQAVVGLVRQVRPTHLLHTAWDVTHGVYWTSQANFDWLASGARLLRAFLEVGGTRAVGVGTCAEYAWLDTSDAPDYREADSPLAPATPYGRCKVALWHAFEAARLQGTSIAWGRLFFPYGPGDGQQRLLPSLMGSLSAKQTFATTLGTQVRDFIHIDDAGAALAALLDSPVQGAVNIGSGVGISLREIVTSTADTMGVDRALLQFGALPIRPGDPPRLVADVSRLKGQVGFTPRVAWGDGIRRTAEAFLEFQLGPRSS